MHIYWRLQLCTIDKAFLHRLTATGYLCYISSIHRLVEEARRVPWREQLLALHAPALAFIVITTFLLAVLLKVLYLFFLALSCILDIAGRGNRVLKHHSPLSYMKYCVLRGRYECFALSYLMEFIRKRIPSTTLAFIVRLRHDGLNQCFIIWN